MPLKEKTVRQRNTTIFAAYLYRIPLPIRNVLQFPDGNCYPICPRCDRTIEREYMSFCDRCGQRLAWDYLDFANIIFAPRRRL